MKLRAKFALYNTLSKLAIILVFVLILPLLIRNITIINTDLELEAKRDQVLAIIDEVGITTFIEEGSGSGYGSYNLLKEEFISIEQNDSVPVVNTIENSPRQVEDEIVEYRVLIHTFSIQGRQYILEVARSLATIHDIESTLKKFGLYTLLIISIITTISDFAFTRLILAPLKKVIRKLRTTRDPTSFNHERVATTTTDFQYLDETIHSMMDRMEAVFTKEREFISNVSHQLLTPVSILQTKLENLLNHSSLTEEAEVKLIESQKSLSRLKSIVQSLLLISRIENNQFIRQDSVSIPRLIEEVHEEIEDRLEMKRIEFRNENISPFTFDRCNKALLHTMLFNLINNAIKYTHEGGAIEVSGRTAGGSYELSIQDNGSGIAPENLSVIFSRFKQFRQSDQDSHGLGLPIVKTIADFHGVEVLVNSRIGSGTKFTLVFPLSGTR